MVKNLVIVWLLVTVVMMGMEISRYKDLLVTEQAHSKMKLDYQHQQCRILLNSCN